MSEQARRLLLTMNDAEPRHTPASGLICMSFARINPTKNAGSYYSKRATIASEVELLFLRCGHCLSFDRTDLRDEHAFRRPTPDILCNFRCGHKQLVETHLELMLQPDLPVEKQETLYDWAEDTTDEMEDLQATLHDKIPGNVSGNLDIQSVLRGR